MMIMTMMMMMLMLMLMLMLMMMMMMMMMMIAPGEEGSTGRSWRCSTSPRKSLSFRQCQT